MTINGIHVAIIVPLAWFGLLWLIRLWYNRKKDGFGRTFEAGKTYHIEYDYTKNSASADGEFDNISIREVTNEDNFGVGL